MSYSYWTPVLCGARIGHPSGFGERMRGFDSLLDSLGLRCVTGSSAANPNPPPAADRRVHIAAYRPVDPGIPAQPIDEVLGVHQDLIDRIKVCYGMDRANFEQDLLGLIRRYAAYVHLLPATPDNYFNAPGGLLHMCLEVAFFSLQGTDGHIFSGRSTITTRRHLEPRWRHATFIAGLCCEIHRTLSHVIVTDERGDEWQPYLLPLSSWLTRHRVSRYFLKWRTNAVESRTLGLFALPHVVPAEVLQHLAAGNAVIVPHMLASISGMPLYRERNILDDLVRRSVALVVDRYLRASTDRYGRPQLGSHMERYLVDALRRLVVADSAWRPNAERSRVWFGADGLFLVWPNAAAEIRYLLESDQLPGIPKAPETMLEILVAVGVFEPKDASQATWQIVPPEAKAAIEAVKLSSPAILFAGLDPSPRPLAMALCRAPESAKPPITPSAAAKPSTSPQLSLPIEQNAEPGTADQTAAMPPPHNADNGATHAPRANGSAPAQLALALPEFRLDAPMRLNPVVRDALIQIVDTLNQDGADTAACTVSAGLFIPLAEFERRNIEPSLALRALIEVKMLVQPAGNRSHTTTRNFGGEQKVGLLLHPRFVAGLDPADFDVPDAGSATC
jgi:conjugal transfer pilus assembly protein TraI